VADLNRCDCSSDSYGDPLVSAVIFQPESPKSLGPIRPRPGASEVDAEICVESHGSKGSAE